MCKSARSIAPTPPFLLHGRFGRGWPAAATRKFGARSERILRVSEGSGRSHLQKFGAESSKSLNGQPRRANHRFAVDRVEPEFRAEAVEPLEVVEQRPMEVAMHRHAIECANVLFDERRPKTIVRVGDPVLGHDERKSALR